MNRLSFHSLFFSLPLLLLWSACGKGEITVQTDTSEVRDLYARVTESGTIQPTIDVPVAPDVSGEVVELAVREGQQVKKGDLLVTIRPDDYEAQLEQATASLSRAQAAYEQAKAQLSQSKATLLQDSVTLSRNEKLFADEVVSKLDLENAQLAFAVSKSQYEAAGYNVRASYYQVVSAQASVKQASQMLDRTNIYASMDGTITQLNVELGQRVVGTSTMAGTEILKVADLSRMEVVVAINENDIVNVTRGDSATVEVDAFPGQLFYGKVSEVAYSASTEGMGSTDQVTNFEVKIGISPESYAQLTQSGGEQGLPGPQASPFRPGMTALVEVYTQKVEDAICVPIQAVTLRQAEGETTDPTARGGQEVVFVWRDGKVEQVPVNTGISDDTHLHITSGLEADQQVVTGPYNVLSRTLRDGMEVAVSKRE